MSQQTAHRLPKTIAAKLNSIRRRSDIITVLRAALAGMTVLMVAMVAAMGCDWAFTLFDVRLRVLLTVTSLVLAAGVLLILVVKGLLESRRIVRAAQSADAHVPQLEERWRTVASFAESEQQPVNPTTQKLLEQVISEAVALERLVEPKQIVRPNAVRPVAMAAGISLLVLVAFMAINWNKTSILWQRFWSPTQLITATTIRQISGDLTVPEGDPLELQAEISGVIPASALLSIEYDSGVRDVFELKPNATHVCTQSLRAEQSFRYQIQAGDGRAEWNAVHVLKYPEFAEIQLVVAAPEYVDRPDIAKSLIPSRLKVVEGSQLKLRLKVAEPVDKCQLQLALPQQEGEPLSLVLLPSVNGWYEYTTQLVEDVTLSPILTSLEGLKNEDRPVCRIQVVADQAPVARVVSPSDEMAVATDDVIDIKFEAHDDHGIATAELVVYDETNTAEGEEPKILKVEQIPLGEDALKKHIMGEVQLDLKELNLPEGANISYAIRVTDNRELTIDPKSLTGQMAQAKPGEDRGDMLARNDAAMGSDNGPAETESDNQTETAESPGARLAQQKAEATEHDPTSGKQPASETDEGEARPMPPSGSELAMANQESTTKDGTPSEKSDSNQQAKVGPSGKQRTGDPGEDDDKTATGTKSGESEKKTAMARNQDGLPEPAEKSDDQLAKVLTSDDPSGKEMPDKNSDPTQPGTAKDKGDQPKGEPGSPASATHDEPELNPNTQSAETKPGEKPDGQASDSPQSSGKPDEMRPGEANPSAKPGDDPSGDSQSKPSLDSPQTAGKPGEMKPGETKPGEAKPGDPADADPTDPGKLAGQPKVTTPGEPMENPNGESPTSKDGMPEPKLSQNGENQNANPNTSQPNPANGNSQTPSQSKPQTGSGQPNDNPPPVLARKGQTSESGQNAETQRQRLKIAARLAAVSRSVELEEFNRSIREQVVAIDNMLAEAEAGLNRLVERLIPDADRGTQFQLLDAQLGNVEEFVAKLRDDTKETEYTFVGLQMMDLTQSHITPARDRVFVGIREPSSAGEATAALHHILRARELLAALLKRYDAIRREREFQREIDESVTMYEVYVEKMQQLMQEARQNRSPLERKMAVLELEQAYLDRVAEVQALRREMLQELARMLANDPRLRSRYLDLIRRRRASMRDQLGELAERQEAVTTELSSWLGVEQDQQADVWMLVTEMRLQTATDLAKDAALLDEHIQQQLPLVLDKSRPATQRLLELSAEMTRQARQVTLDSKEIMKSAGVVSDGESLVENARKLLITFDELQAALDQMQFDHEGDEDIAAYVPARQLEARAVMNSADDWLQIATAIRDKRYAGLAWIDQDKLAIATELLRTDMLDLEQEITQQFARVNVETVPGPILDLVRELQGVMESLTFRQQSATYALTVDNLPAAETSELAAMADFRHAEELFDKLRKALVAALDEYDLPNPNIADLRDPTLDDFLARLEREQNIEAQLGLPNRPTNLRVISDMVTSSQSGGNPLANSGEQSLQRMRQMMQQQLAQQQNAGKPQGKPEGELTNEEREQRDRQRQTEEMLEKSLAAIKEKQQDPKTPDGQKQQLDQLRRRIEQLKQNLGDRTEEAEEWQRRAEGDETAAVLAALAQGERLPDSQWNKLFSSLDDGLWQVNGKVPPEAYRRAIEQYQERLRQLTNGTGE